MANPEVSVFDVEFIYALGDEPVSIGSGSYKQLSRLNEEKRAIDAQDRLENPNSTAVLSPGTEHFVRGVANIGGVSIETVDAVLGHYTVLVEQSRAALIQRIGRGLKSS